MTNPTTANRLFAVWLFFAILLSMPWVAVSGQLKQLAGQSHPSRMPISGASSMNVRLEHPHAVVMHHSSFYLDPAVLPGLSNRKPHVLLQLEKNLTETMETELTKHDVELLEYIPHNTWKARVSPSQWGGLQKVTWVRAIGDILIEDKMPQALLQQIETTKKPMNGKDLIPVSVSFYDDISLQCRQEIVNLYAADQLKNQVILGEPVQFRIRMARIRELAHRDEVSWIEQGGRTRSTINADAAQLSNVDHVQNGEYGLDGKGVVIGQWDGGAVDDSHQDLMEQVDVHTSQPISVHATGVAGTLVGRNKKSARGMAPGANLNSYSFRGQNVPNAMKAVKRSSNVVIANHSWVYRTGWEFNCYGHGMWTWFEGGGFGRYTPEASHWDAIIRSESIISFNGVGNDRNDVGAQPGEAHYHNVFDDHRLFYCSHPPDSDDGCINDIASAKNVISVGAVDDNAEMSEFSSWGPTMDGRLKPDLVANGVGIYTTYPNNDYKSHFGTSFATPVVSGSAALLIQAYRKVMETDPTPAMVKAMLVNTAKDLGEPGPDYQHGWGLLDLKPAIDMIASREILYNENQVSPGLDRHYRIEIPEQTPELKITIAWSDRAGSPSAGKALVNDIDLVVKDPQGQVHLPWILDPDNPNYPAQRGVNTIDNVEQILVDNPTPGIWNVTIKGSDIQVSQEYALVSNLSLQEFVKVGSVFDLHLEVSQMRSCPSVSSGNDNLFITVWSQWNPEDGQWDIQGKYFFDTYEGWKEEFKANNFTEYDQQHPVVETLSDDSFVVVWESLDQDSSGSGIFGQRFNLVGGRLGEEFQINTYYLGDQIKPTIAALESGGFVVVWTSIDQDGHGTGIYAQLFRDDGTFEGQEFRVNTTTENDQSEPSVSSLKNGGFIITWQSHLQDGEESEIVAQCFDNMGQKMGSEFQVNTFVQGRQQTPNVRAISDHSLIITWISKCDSGQNIMGQLFSLEGQKIGSEFRINTCDDLDNQKPVIANIDDDGFMVTWNVHNPEKSLWEIKGQFYDSTGIKKGGVFQVTEYSGGTQSFYSLDRLTCNRYMLTWCTSNFDTQNSTIQGRQFMQITKPYVDITADNSNDSDENSGCLINLLMQ